MIDPRTQIAKVQRTHREELCEENVCICGHHGNYPKHVADAVIEALGPIPNRSFVDDRNNRWEWCGGEPGTWAWRITRLGPEPLHTMYPRNPDGRDYEPF